MSILGLKWNNHHRELLNNIHSIWQNNSYSDVTLACERKLYKVHKFILSSCSDYFKQIFENSNLGHLVIVLKDIRCQDLDTILEYMYVGEVSVHQNDLSSLMNAAEVLEIKGLAVPEEENIVNNSLKRKSTSDNSNDWRKSNKCSKQSKQRGVTPNQSEICEVSDENTDISHTQPMYQEVTKINDPIRLDTSEIKKEVQDQNDDTRNCDASFPFSEVAITNSIFHSTVPDNHAGTNLHATSSPKYENSAERFSKEEFSANSQSSSLSVISPEKQWENRLNADRHFMSVDNGDMNAYNSVNQEDKSELWSSPPNQLSDQNQSCYGASGSTNAMELSNELLHQTKRLFDRDEHQSLENLVDKTSNQNVQSKYFFACSFCGKIFNHRTNHLAHERIHTGEKPFKCIYCPYRSSLKGNLKNHIICKHQSDWKTVKHLINPSVSC